MGEYNIKLDNNAKWLCFKIYKGEKYLYEFFPVDNGNVKFKLYLPFGTGNYDITASISTNYVDSFTHAFKFSLSHKYFNPSSVFFALTHTKEGEK